MAAGAVEQEKVEQESTYRQRATGSARCGRRHRNLFGCIAILVAETEPLMQACYSVANDLAQRV